MSTEERALQLENAFRTLVELARTQSERRDKYKCRSEELAKAQENTAPHIEELAELQKKTGVLIKEIAEAQKQTKAHLSVLAEVMAELERAQARTERASLKASSSTAAGHRDLATGAETENSR